MKIRTNFISNSSSTSFVAIGRYVDVPPYFDDDENCDQEDKWASERIYIESNKGDYIEGTVLWEGEEDDEMIEYDLKQLQNIIEDLAKTYHCDKSEFKLIIGERPC